MTGPRLERDQWAIRCLVPDLPAAEDLLPYLREIDTNRWYTNFGPLVARYEAELVRFIEQARGDAGPPPNIGGTPSPASRDVERNFGGTPSPASIIDTAREDAGPPLTAVTFSSGTQALTLTLRALDLPAGGRVLLPAFTFPATLLAVLDAGLTPLLADVDPETWMLEPALARAVVGEHADVRAVLPVGTFGYPVALDPWIRFQAQSGVRVVLDAAAGLGMQPFAGTPSPASEENAARGDAGPPPNGGTPSPASAAVDIPVVFSLHATKPLGAGEGGVLLTRNDALATQARRLSNFGFERWVVREPGTNAKLSEYHAAVGLAQLGRAGRLLQQRRQVLEAYRSRLPAGMFRAPRTAEAGQESIVPASLSLHTRGQAAVVVEQMTRQRIETRRWYYPPLHGHAAFRDVARVRGDLPATEELARSLVGVPLHNFLSDADIHRVAEVLLQVLDE